MSIVLDLTDPTVKQKLAELPEKMTEAAYQIMMEQAHLIVGLAQVYCPVDTGSLRDSIRVERGGEGKAWREVRVRAGGYVTNPETGRIVNYARFQEEGTRYIIGIHFLSDAVEQVRPTIEEMIRSGVANKINE